MSLNSLHTRLEASVERRSVWNSSVALRCASRDSGSWPSTTWKVGCGRGNGQEIAMLACDAWGS